MGEVKHVFLDECLLDLFISPINEQLVVEVCLLCETAREVYRILESCTVPVCFQQDAQLLGPTQSEDRNQDFSSLV